MAPYEPRFRRPIAGAFRRTAAAAVRFCVRFGVHPDAVSYASIAASAGAAWCLWRAGDDVRLLLAAPLLCHLRLWFNMLDGMVAIASGKASPRGELVNELPDRVSDALIFAGLAGSGLCRPALGWTWGLGALFAAHVGVLGQAVGARREFGGIQAKPWRMVLLHAGAWGTAAFLLADRTPAWRGWTLLDATAAAGILGCVQTAAVRLRRIVRTLPGPGESARGSGG